MDTAPWDDPALTLALALAVGMAAQVLARHLRLPGIVLLLAAGVLLGPDVAGLIRPAALGDGLHELVGFAVAIILFEGGMNLDLDRLRREARSIRQLVTVGAAVTAVGAALAARLALGWSWPLAALFGTLVMVTGPTVINPLLRRIKVTPNVSTVLAAEGVMIDAVGAIVAVVALEVVVGPPGHHWAFGAWDVATRLLFGAVAGAIGGVTLAVLLRNQRVVPEGLESVFSLASVLLLYQGADALVPDTGIVAAVVGGLVVGNAPGRVVAELREFKEQLSVLFVGVLFVLLAADVRLAEVASLGGGGVAVLLLLMLVVRPLNVLAGTWGAGLTWRERAFIAWLAPRGIVAAAISSLFADRLSAAGLAGGDQLRAMVFLVIAGTVLVQGLTGGVVASRLGVRRRSNDGYVVLGASAVARALGGQLAAAGERVVLVDSNPASCRAAADAGLEVLHGNALDPELEDRLELDTRAGCLAMTTNEELNLLFARRARKEHRVAQAWVALQSGALETGAAAADAGARVLFGRPRPLAEWNGRLELGEAEVGWWSPPGGSAATELAGGVGLPLVWRRGRQVSPMDETTRLQSGDRVCLVADPDARAALLRAGWTGGETSDGGARDIVTLAERPAS